MFQKQEVAVYEGMKGWKIESICGVYGYAIVQFEI